MESDSVNSRIVSTLKSDVVDVWIVSLDKWPLPTDSSTLLSDDEMARAECLKTAELRRKFIASHMALRLILGRYLNVSPQEIQYACDSHGKPTLRAGQRQLAASNNSLHFNLAHSGELAMIAVAIDCEVGIDVEQIRPVSHLEQLARRYFHPAEASAVCSIEIESRAERFLRCWTRKEAVLKAIGLGMQYPLNAFQVPCDVNCEVRIDLPARDGVVATDCWLTSIEPAHGYVAAVAIVESEPGRPRPRFITLRYSGSSRDSPVRIPKLP